MKTALEIYEAFLIELDKHSSPDAEVVDFLHAWRSGVYSFIESELLEFELTNKVTDRLRMISKPLAIDLNTSSDCSKPVKEADLPGDYYRLFGVKAIFEYSKDDDFKKRKGKLMLQPVKKLTADIENFSIGNKYYRPSENNPFYQIFGNRIEFVYETMDKPADHVFIKQATLRYVKQPEPLELSDDFSSFNSSEFPVDVNMLILKAAVVSYMSSTGDQRIQLKSQL